MLTKNLAIAAAITAGALVAVAPVHADPVLNGHWVETTTVNGKPRSNDWYFTPCGAGCAKDRDGATAHLQGSNWVMDDTSNTICDDGTEVDDVLNSHYSFDASSGAGTVTTSYIRAACGQPAGGSQTTPVTFRPAP